MCPVSWAFCHISRRLPYILGFTCGRWNVAYRFRERDRVPRNEPNGARNRLAVAQAYAMGDRFLDGLVGDFGSADWQVRDAIGHDPRWIVGHLAVYRGEA